LTDTARNGVVETPAPAGDLYERTVFSEASIEIKLLAALHFGATLKA
jgi:hypothetical protein